jgi:putative spermidine/putrescine transport system permease protein
MKNGGKIWLYIVVALVYVLILSPIIVVIAVSFDDTGLYQFPPRHLSLKWFVAFFESKPYFTSFINVSLPVGLMVAAAATLLGTLVAIGLTRFRFSGRNAAEMLFVSPLFVPEILFAAALYLIYAQLGLRSSLFTIAAGHLVVALPFVVRSVTAGLVGIDPVLEEAARNLGASRPRAFWLATLPLLQSSIVSGAVFAFIVSFSDINLALFLSGPGTTTLPVHIFSQLQFRDDPTIAAASCLQIVLVGTLLLVLHRLFRVKFSV